MAEVGKITIGVDSTAISGLHDRIARMADVCTKEEAACLIDFAEELAAAKSMFWVEITAGSGVAVIGVNPGFLSELASLEARYGL